MKQKWKLISIPMAITPYLALFVLVLIYLSPTTAFFGWIMEEIFHNNGILLIATFSIICVIHTVLTIICSAWLISRKQDALAVAKTAMIIKLIQIPAYILIFVLGVLLVIAIWTIPFSIALFLVDCLSVFMTGLLVFSSVVISLKNKHFKFKEVFWIVLLQFVFCLDVIAAVLLYRKLKRI